VGVLVVTAAMILACAGQPGAPSRTGEPAASDPRPDPAQTERAPFDVTRLMTSTTPSAAPSPDVGADCQPEVFDPAQAELPAEGASKMVRPPHYDEGFPDGTLTWERLPAADGLDVRLYTFSGCNPVHDVQDHVLEVRRDGARIALYTHLDMPPALAPDGVRALVSNAVRKGGTWEVRKRVIDLKTGDKRVLPALRCLTTDVLWLDDGSVIASDVWDAALGGDVERCRVLPDGQVTGSVRFDPVGISGPGVRRAALRQDPLAELFTWRITCHAALVDYRTGEVSWLEHDDSPIEQDFVCPWFAGLHRWQQSATSQTFPRAFTRTGSRDGTYDFVVAPGDTGAFPARRDSVPACLNLAGDGVGDTSSLEETELGPQTGANGTLLTATCAGDEDTVYGLALHLPDGSTELRGPLAAPPAFSPDGSKVALMSWSPWSKEARHSLQIVSLASGSEVGTAHARACLGSRVQWHGDRVFTSTTREDLVPGQATHQACLWEPDGTLAGLVEFSVDGVFLDPARADPLPADPDAVVVRLHGTCSAAVVHMTDGTVVHVEHPPLDESKKEKNGITPDCDWFDALDAAMATSTFESLPRTF